MKILLKNANIISHNGDILVNQDIFIKNGIIEQIGEKIITQADEVVDCTDKFVAPGFVAMHAHTPMNIFKGIAEDVNIDDWFNKELWPYESKMQDDDIYWGAKLACAEMANNGITAFADHYFKGELIAKACEEIGLKADIAYTIFGFGGDCKAELESACKFYNDYKGNKIINPRMGPHSPYICSKDVLKTIVDKAKELECGIHIHVSETEAQVKESYANYNQSPFEVVSEVGGFDVPCIVGHGLWIEESDLKFLNDKACVAVSPKTYTKLGMYKGKLWEYTDKLNAVSGNDGSASSNNIDVLEQMRLFALLGKWNDNAEGFTLKQIWQILMRGHSFLNFNSGKIEPGYSADLNVFDLSMVSTAPVYNPLASIIYSSNSSNIVHVMVNGRFIKYNGELCFNHQEIIKNASRCAKEIYKRGKGNAKIYF